MKQSLSIAFLLAGSLTAAPRLFPQTPAPASPQNQGSSQNQASSQNQPPAQKPSTPAGNSGNAFPEDENSVPVLPSKDAPDIPFDAGADRGRASLPAYDKDPVRSPDDSASGGGQQQSFSSSLSGLDTMAPDTGDQQPGKHKKGQEQIVPEHQETAKEDLNVGKYYLDNKDWKAALSRFQSALVLAPDEPDVYWGLAESERHLGNFAEAKGYYKRVIEYDPDSRHAKDAAKTLKEPELANVKSASVPSAQ